MDLVINMDATWPSVQNGLAQVFHVAPTSIRMLDADSDDWWQDSEKYKILCPTRQTDGDFRLELRVILMDRTLFPSNELESIGSLCDILGCEALTTTGSTTVNPYEWTLVRGTGNYYCVRLDPDLMDADTAGFRIIELQGKL